MNTSNLMAAIGFAQGKGLLMIKKIRFINSEL